MSNSGTVDAGRQVQSPASAGSRGLAKTTQFTKDPTQMKMGNSPIAESMIEIRNILNRIDGINVPVKEDAGDEAMAKEIAKVYDNVAAYIQDDSDNEPDDQGGLRSGYDDEDLTDAQDLADAFRQGLQSGLMLRKKIKMKQSQDSGDMDKGDWDPFKDGGVYNDLIKDILAKYKKPAVKEDDRVEKAMKDMQPSKVTGYYEITDFWKEHTQMWGKDPETVKYEIADWMVDEMKPDNTPEREELTKRAWAIVDDALKNNKDDMTFDDMIDQLKSKGESEDSDELARLKELAGIEEDTRTERRYTSDQIDQLKQWAKKYSQYKNIEGENLIEALYEYVFEMGIRQLAFEKGELQAAEKKIGKEQEDWEDAEIEAAMEMSPISSGLMDDLENIIPGNVELEKKLDTIRTMLQKAGLKEDPYRPFPEEDEMTFEDDDEFYEAFGELGFPEDENELFDAEYRGRKVPLNKPMRGDVKKFKVYVKDPKSGNVKKVNFGHGGSSARRAGQKTMKIRKSNPKARKSFRARHNCANPGPKTKARYWSCRKW
jgi:hypothetical protein